MNLETITFDAPSTPTGPTMLCLPGLGQSAADFVEISGLRDVATQLGRKIVFAMPEDRVWNYLRPSPSMQALINVATSLGTVDLCGFSAGAVMIYSYLSCLGPGSDVRRAVSYAGEQGWSRASHPSPIAVLMLRNQQDQLVDEQASFRLKQYYEASGCQVTLTELDPPEPWPTYPGASLGHFFASSLANPLIAEFLK